LNHDKAPPEGAPYAVFCAAPHRQAQRARSQGVWPRYGPPPEPGHGRSPTPRRRMAPGAVEARSRRTLWTRRVPRARGTRPPPPTQPFTV